MSDGWGLSRRFAEKFFMLFYEKWRDDYNIANSILMLKYLAYEGKDNYF